MATVTYFTLTGTLSSAPGGPPSGSPPLKAVYGDVTITPLIGAGDALQADTLVPPTVLFMVPSRVRVVYGVLKCEGTAGVRLPANTAVLALDGDLFYRVTFTNMVSNGEKIDLKTITFQAPTGDTVIDLVDVIPVPGSGASGGFRGSPGAPVDDVQFVDVDTIRFYVLGSPIGVPIELPGGTGTSTIDGGSP